MKFGLHRWMAKELETLINLHQKVRSGFLSLIFSLSIILTRVSIAVVKHHGQKRLGEEIFISF